MLHKTVLILAAAACMAVSAATLVTGSTTRTAIAKNEVTFGYFGSRHAPSKLLGGCPEALVECGLVVW